VTATVDLPGREGSGGGDSGGEAVPGARPRRPVGRGLADLLSLLGYLAGGVWVTGHLWLDPVGRAAKANAGDTALFEWNLAYAARLVTHFDDPFFTTLMNAPFGVNLMANTVVLLPGVVLSPVTLVAGPAVSLVLLLTLSLTGTAYAWYHVLSRHVVASRAAAFVGAGFCGFAPVMLGHSNAHPHLTGQYLVPFIVWRVLAMRRAHRWRDGVVLGVLLTAQAFVGLEVLFLTAIGCVVFMAAHAATFPRQAYRRGVEALPGWLVGAGVATVLMAYPLWVFFFGAQSYRGIRWDLDHYSTDASAFLIPGPMAVGGRFFGLDGVGYDPAETGAFFGQPLLILVLLALVFGRGLPRVLAVSTLPVFALTLGPSPRAQGRPLPIPGLYRLVDGLPVFDATLPTRFNLPLATLVGVLLALGWQRAAGLGPGRQSSVAKVVIAAALIPLLPMPLPVTGRQPIPRFITSGHWRSCLPAGRTLMPVPVTDYYNPDGMRWAAVTGIAFPIAQGIGVVPGEDGHGQLIRPTASGVWTLPAGEVTEKERVQARHSLARLDVGCVVVDERRPDLIATVNSLVGPGRRVDDVWVWDRANGIG
jgi:hypothetical protein